MVEKVADEYIASAQHLLDLNVKDWSDDDWEQWQQLINIFRRVKSETINNIKPFQKMMFDWENRYFAVTIPFEERQKFEIEPHNFDPTNFQMRTDRHNSMIEPAIVTFNTYIGETNKHLHRLFPIIRLHQKGIQGLLERLFELGELNQRLEDENDDLKAELEGNKKIPLSEVVERDREEEEDMPEFRVPKKIKKKAKPKKKVSPEEEEDVPEGKFG